MKLETNLLSLYPTSKKILVRSDACFQYDSEGKKYIDFESGVWCTNLGHSNSEINRVIIEQLEKSIHHGYKFMNRESELLAEKLNELTGFENGKSVFLSSGSEAVNLAISLSRVYTQRKKILTLSNSYLSAFGFGRISAENTQKIDVPFNSTEFLSNIDFNEIAAFVLETGGASVGMVQFPDLHFIQELVCHAKAKGCLIIADEVTTGMGRLGSWFGYQPYQIEPHMVVCGKALGNGYPVSSITVNKMVSDYFNENALRYAQSHQNDPLGCAIGLAVIQTIENQDLIARCNEMGGYFIKQLEHLKKEYPNKIKQIRGKGLMLAIEFTQNVDGEKIYDFLFEQGFVTGYKTNTLRFLPPLIISKFELDTLVTALKIALSK